MVAGKPDDYVAVIQANKHRSLAILIADRPDCIDGWEKFALRGRAYRVSDAPGLRGFQPPKRCLAIILACPGQTVAEPVVWCRQHGIHALRIRFVLHPDCDEFEMFCPWYEQYEEDPVVQYATKFPPPNGAQKALGEWYNDWIYLDAKGRSWPLST